MGNLWLFVEYYYLIGTPNNTLTYYMNTLKR